ncbi:MAG TPA: heme lyase CcmF/NrfE family subunit [Actinomycetales bacterium]|nr:heme lyase CcmF/NrfE family subunit [Actinomycetales bacterium]
MSQVGQVTILLGLLVALYGTAVAAVGARTARPALVDSARRCAYVLLAFALVINGAMLLALLRNDFAVKYVAENSSRSTPTFYKVLALWAADDGSLLLWNLVLAGYVAAVALRFRRDRPATFPYALSVLLAVQVFYLSVVSGPARPFATLTDVPPDGRGPSPLLQNHPLMAVHPPFLYLGFIGFTVPFAFGIAALLVGRAGARWSAITRRWTLAVWCFLTVGLLLGALWSYSVLGWGGYWAWDPVENVALLPWLVATAFLHSAMLEERRGIGRLWNVVLVISAFALMTFGTFLTRGNVLTSIHAFTESGVGPAYLVFLAVVLLGGFGLVAWRLPQLRPDARLDSVLSREGAFIGNNVLLLSATAILLLGTVFPMVVEAATGDRMTVGAPYFRTALAPVFLLLLLLVGTAPRLGWRATDSSRALRRLRLPVLTAAVVVVVTALAGVRQPQAVAGFGLAALVAATNASEIASGLVTGRRGGRAGAWRTLRRGRRHYAALTVHVGLAVLAAGVTASATLARQTEVTLSAGQATSFDGYRLRYEGMRTQAEPRRAVLTTTVSVTDPSGARGHTLRPRLNLYPGGSEPIGSPSIDRGAVWDLYSSVVALQDNGRSATFRFYRNPGVNWLWLGGAVMVLGGLAAAWPGRRPRPATRPALEAAAERGPLAEVGSP